LSMMILTIEVLEGVRSRACSNKYTDSLIMGLPNDYHVRIIR